MNFDLIHIVINDVLITALNELINLLITKDSYIKIVIVDYYDMIHLVIIYKQFKDINFRFDEMMVIVIKIAYITEVN